MPTIGEIRQQYPQYSDMSDQQLGDALYSKFYSDMPRAQFDAKVGAAPAASTPQPAPQAPPAAPSMTAAITDIPREAYNATADSLKSIGANLNPFSDERRKAYEAGGMLGPMLSTGKGLASLVGLPMAPIQGAARSLIGHPLEVADTALRQGAANIYGDANVPQPVGYEGLKGEVDKALMALRPAGSPVKAPAPPGYAPGKFEISPTQPAYQWQAPSGGPMVAPPPPPALEANIAAQNIGVDLPRAIATDSPITKFMGQVANKLPGGGPMQTGISEAMSQTGQAVGRAADLAGGVTDPLAAGQGFRGGVENSFKPAVKAKVSAAYDAVDNLMPPNFTRPLNETQNAIADIVARRQASGESDPGKAVNTVLGGAMRPGGLTYAGVKDLRTRVGEMLDTGVFPEGMSQGELRRIYGSLSDDLKATVQAGGGSAAASAFNRANSLNKFVEDWKDNIGKVLGADRSGEGVTTAILRAASNGPSADLKALTMARGAVPKTAWQDISSTVVSTLGRDKKGEFSPAIFLNDFARLSDGGKRLLFNSVGSGDVLPYLNDIATVSKKFVDAGKLANTSGTAGHNAAYTMLGGGAAGLLHGSLIEPVTAISTVVGNNLMARALAAPASAASVARWSRAYATLAANPGPASFSTFKIAARNLANTLNGNFGSRIQPADFIRAIQAPVTGRADQDQQSNPGLPAQ